MRKVLIVDDEPLICTMLADWLREYGYDPVPAHSGVDALREVKDTPPELILLDLVMPGLSGLAVLQALKTSEKTSRIPVIILTGVGSGEDKVRCLDAGAEEFLSKPVDKGELLARARSLLRAKSLSDRLLMSYFELDNLGNFAEHFAGQIGAEMTTSDVATSLARQLLGAEAGLSGHPAYIWGGMLQKDKMFGLLCYYRGSDWHQDTMEVSPSALEHALAPFSRGDGQYLSKDPIPAHVCRLLGIPPASPPANFAAHASDKYLAIAAGYPWEVGFYELPLLKALTRHWSVFERIRFETRQTAGAFVYIMEALAFAAEFYDPTTGSHLKRVSAFSTAIARAIGCDERFLRKLAHSAQMHDVGKITIPVEITRKPGPLTDREYRDMQRHTVQGAQILGDKPNLEMARNIARSHHESYDGTGYPEGRREDEIPVEARIVKIADIYDALRTARSYKKGFSHEDALRILSVGDGRTVPSQFDARILTAFHDIHGEILEIYENVTRPPSKSPPAS